MHSPAHGGAGSPRPTKAAEASTTSRCSSPMAPHRCVFRNSPTQQHAARRMQSNAASPIARRRLQLDISAGISSRHGSSGSMCSSGSGSSNWAGPRLPERRHRRSVTTRSANSISNAAGTLAQPPPSPTQSPRSNIVPAPQHAAPAAASVLPFELRLQLPDFMLPGRRVQPVVVAPESQEPSQKLQQLLGELEQQRDHQQMHSTLMGLVELALAKQLPLASVIRTNSLSKLTGIMLTAPLNLSALAAEVLCRAVSDQDMNPFVAEIQCVIGPLVSFIQANGMQPEPAAVPALFFATSSIVRLAGQPQLASAVIEAGGVETLVGALHITPATLSQVTTLALFKLHKAAEAAGQLQEEQLLLQLTTAGGFPRLCSVLQHVEGSAGELAFTLLLDLALQAKCQQQVADRGELGQLVAVLRAPANDGVRMKAILVAARVANNSTDCQLDMIREGAAVPIVALLHNGSDDDRSHAARLLAILVQHPSTHQMAKEAGALQAVVGLISGQGSAATAAISSGSSGGSNGMSEEEHAAQLHTQVQANCATASDSAAAKRAREAVLEQAVSVLAVLAHNADNHFEMVNLTIVPAVVPLLTFGSPKVQTYVLALLLMLCMAETRHAAVVVRTGAVPPLVSIIREGTNSGNREFAAAVLSSLAKSYDNQLDIVSAGGILACIRLISEGTSEARCHAAEVLLQMAATTDVRRRLMCRAGALDAVQTLLEDEQSPEVQLWGSQLLGMLVIDTSVRAQVVRTPAMLLALCKVIGAPVEAGFRVQEVEARGGAERARVQGVQGAARAQAAWLVARLADSPFHQDFVTVVGLIPALVVMLREAQTQQQHQQKQQEQHARSTNSNSSSCPDTPAGIRQFLEQDANAAAAAALLALSRNHSANTTAILHQLTLELWMGRHVRLDGLCAETRRVQLAQD